MPKRFLPMIILICAGCVGLENPKPAIPSPAAAQEFFITRDGLRLQFAAFKPAATPSATVYVAPGITGMNLSADRDVIDLLVGGDRRVVVIFPRGTGYSEGARGDIESLDRFVGDFLEGMAEDAKARTPDQRVFLFGHSMSCAVALAAAQSAGRVDGVILVNPPLRRKPSPGMTPSWGEYLRYAAYYLFAPHVPIVNMAGNPEQILDPDERAEALRRYEDPLLVKYFSLHYMLGVQKLIGRMADLAARQSVPLLLIHGEKDSVAEQKGSEEILAAWSHPDKRLVEISDGPHGKETVLKARGAIQTWMLEHLHEPGEPNPAEPNP